MQRSNVYKLFSVLVISTLLSQPETISAQHSPTNAAELSVKKLQPAPDLKVELFASEPLFQNPVAFSIDERGRLFIAESHRWKDSIFDVTKETNWLQADLSFRKVEDRAAFLEKQFATNLNILTKDSELVRLVEDRDGDGRAETSSVIANGFNQTVSGVAAGILARNGEVWFTCIPDLWKFTMEDLRLTNQSLPAAAISNARPSQIVNRQSLATGFGVHVGVSGHDLHGLVMGPDGKIYFSSGDRGFSVRTKEGKFFNYPDTGGVLRCDPDGSNLEVFATGLRNPQELAFDQYGNLFTADNDTAGEDPSRVVYVVEGGDYGWRASYQFMEGFGPWVQEKNWLGGIDGTLPGSGDVAQGPAGLAFYPGTGLPEKYQNHFLVCDFPKGVWSFAVKQKGSGYEVVDKEKFLWNLGPTDVDFGPDGAAYVLDWGTSYSMPGGGRIYRVFDPAQRESSTAADIKKVLAEGMDARSDTELQKLLAHADLRVRREAQFAVVNRGRHPKSPEAFLKVWMPTPDKSFAVRLHTLQALAQIGEKYSSRYPTGVEKLVALLDEKDAEILAQILRTLGYWAPKSVPAEVLLHLQNENSRVRYFAAMSLGKWKALQAINPLLEMLKHNADADPYLTHAGVWALVNIGDFNAIQSAAKSKNVSIRRAALLWMRRMERVETAQFLNDANPNLVREAARAINDLPINEAMPQLAALLDSRILNLKADEFAQVMRRAINANFRLGANSNAVALARFAAQLNSPEAMRAEALDALADWENPNALDRVMALWRPLPRREVATAQNAFRSVSSEVFKSDSEKVLIAAVRCARKLKLDEPEFFPLFQATRSPAVRVEILQALAESKSESLAKAVELALADTNGPVRREGIKTVALLAPDQTPPLLEQILATETDLRLKQTALATLGKLTNGAATDALLRQLDLLHAGKIGPELRLDLLDAAGKKSDSRITASLERFTTSQPGTNSLAEYQTVLVGGDAERGKKIFHEREDVACLRCHAIKGVGGNVGPDLSGIATKRSREYLLESILEPNKQIAPGFENIVVTLKSGTAAAGLVKSEDDIELVLNSPEDGIVKIKKTEIEKRERGLSPMPEEMVKVLTKFELRDLVEFLASLK